jgi:hypothetical protein
MKAKYLSVLILFLCLAGCSWTQAGRNRNSEATTTPPQELTLSTKITTPTVTLTPIVTKTRQPTLTSTFTATPLPVVTPQAWQPQRLADGILLFNPVDNDLAINKFSRDLPAPLLFSSQNECCAMDTMSGYYSTSPNHQYAAYLRYERQGGQFNIYLIITDGVTQTSVLMDDLKALSIAYWLNDQEVLLFPDYYEHLPWFPEEELLPLGTLISYNPFTKETRQIVPSFPDLIDGTLYRTHNWTSAPFGPKYDPSFLLAVYYSDRLSGEPSPKISLWDLQSATEIWHRNIPMFTQPPFPSEPMWAPDGSQFAIFIPDAQSKTKLELTLVSRDGTEQVVQLPYANILSGSGITWSPDSAYISFFVVEDYLVHMVVYNVVNKELWELEPVKINTKEMLAENVYLVYSFTIWSSDSTQFLTKSITWGDEKFIYLVDVQNRQIYDFPYPFNNAVWLTAKE